MSLPVNCSPEELDIYLRGLEVGYLPTSSWGMFPFSQSRSSDIAKRSLLRDITTVLYRGFQYSTMCRRSTVGRGVGSSICSPGDFRARTLAVQELERDSLGRDLDCGESSQESSMRSDLDVSRLKIHRCSQVPGVSKHGYSKWWVHSLGPHGTSETLLSASGQIYSGFWRTFPKWGMMRSGELSERTMPGHLTSVIGSGLLLPTPTRASADKEVVGSQGGYNIVSAAKQNWMWRTPSSQESGIKVGRLETRNGEELGSNCRHYDKGTGRLAQIGLNHQVQIFPTPLANDALKRGEFDIQNPRNGLPAAVKRLESFPTPCATDYKGEGVSGELRDRLDYAAERGATKSRSYPTPGTSGMSNDSGNCEKINKLAEEGCISEEERRSMRSGNGGQLNPTWVEWLMGWPIGWTDLNPLEMGKFRSWLQSQRSAFEEIRKNLEK